MSGFFTFVFAASIVVAVVQQYFKHSRSSHRRIYWSCVCVGAIAGFLAVYPDLRKGSIVALACLGMMAFIAYAYTPYIKLGHKIYALTVYDGQPDDNEIPAERLSDAPDHSDFDPAPDAYSGLITAAKTWWMYVLLLGFISINAYAFTLGEGRAWVAGSGIAFLVFLSVASGYGDASWGYPIARGQRIQFGIATAITAGTFAVLYLVAYYAGKRRPLRRKQSMEYRAHPRHRNPE